MKEIQKKEREAWRTKMAELHLGNFEKKNRPDRGFSCSFDILVPICVFHSVKEGNVFGSIICIN